MGLLLIGMLLFAGIHLLPALAPAWRSHWQARLGRLPYMGVFSLPVLLALGLIVAGWRSMPPHPLYTPPAVLHTPALALLGFAFLLFSLSKRPSRLRQWVRHPQLVSVILWGIAHLLLNGEWRSTVLFGGMALWAAVNIAAINRRDGVWIKTAPPPWGTELRSAAIAAVVIAAVVFAHPWLSGRAVF